jgi:hypothetical protein
MSNVFNESNTFNADLENIIDNFEYVTTDLENPVFKVPILIKHESLNSKFCGGHHTVNINGENIGNYPECKINVEDFFTYNKLEKYTYVATENFTEIATASTYKQSLHMDGAINEKAFYMDSQILEKPYMVLQTQVGKSFKDIGKQLLFDTSNGLFRLDEEFVNGYNVYWGYSGKVNNYTIDETHITFPEILENGVYPLIYDKTSANPLPLFSNFTFSKGSFARGTSMVFLGENLAKAKYRQLKEDYYETSTLHLSHGKRDRITLVDQNSIYKNTNSYWTNTFRTLGPFE